jgi:spermidine synthase
MSDCCGSVWHTELESKAHGKTFRVDRMLIDTVTPYQRLRIFDNEAVGKVFLLDDVVMLTERDEYIYHEMLVHPALLAHPDPKRILIVGGGDGGTLREVVKHPEVEEAVLCEIDEVVIAESRRHLPFTAVGLDHPKSTVVVGDALEYIRNHRASFDVILVDSTDPVGCAEGLFRNPFYEDVKKALKKGGIMAQQTESPIYEITWFTRIYKELDASFPHVHCYQAVIPMYPGALWTFTLAGTDTDPRLHFSRNRALALEDLRYYSAEMHEAAFVLPRWVRTELDTLKGQSDG